MLAPRKTRSIDAFWLGRRRYSEVLRLQEQLHAARRAGELTDTVLLLEHEPVITFGRGGKAENLVASAEALAAAGVDVVRTGRGGDVTLHVPGQLVCYPILDLSPDRRDVRRYVKDLAEVMRRVVAEYGLSAGTIERYVGLWVDAESPAYWSGEELAQEPLKVGAIGVSISRWVTMHGFALNVCPELAAFGYIVPCGIREHGVSSVRELSHAQPRVRDAAERVLFHLGEVFDARVGALEDALPASWARLASASDDARAPALAVSD